jgi:uncharacterized protein
MAIEQPDAALRSAPAPSFLTSMKLRWLEGRYRVCRLEASQPVPEWAEQDSAFMSISRTSSELSVVTDERNVPSEVRSEGPFAAMVVVGPLDFEIVGLLAWLTGLLANAKIPVFVVSTFDTDVIMVLVSRRHAAHDTLEKANAGCFATD